MSPLKKKYIILSGLEYKTKEELLDFGKAECVLLGPWCKPIKSLGEVASALNVKNCYMTSAHENEKNSFYILDLYDRILPSIALSLNNEHSTEFDLEFWSFLLSYWLMATLSMFHNRYKRLEYLLEKLDPSEEFNALISVRWQVAPETTDELINYYQIPEINHYVFSKILRFLSPDNLKLIELECLSLVAKKNIGPPKDISLVKEKLKSVLRTSVQKTFSMFSPRKILLSANYGPTYRTLPLFSLALYLQKFRPRYQEKRTTQNANNQKRNSPCFEPKNNFEAFVKQHILEFLPLNIKFSFDQLLHAGKEKFNSYKKYKVLVVDPFHQGKDEEKIAYGLYKQNGGKLSICQHGSYYGTLRSYPLLSRCEFDFADRYYTWGWTSGDQNKFKGLPSLFLTRSLKKRTKQFSDYPYLLFVSDYYGYFRGGYSSNCASFGNSLNLLIERVNFIRLLKESVFDSCIFRPYPYLGNNLDEASIFRKEFPGLNISVSSMQKKQSGDIYSLLKRTKILVLDYPGTTLHLAMAANIPCVLYWKEDDWLFSREAEPIFRLFRAVGILWDDAEGAAHHINNIWNDVSLWWSALEVQDARKMFCQKFAKADNLFSSLWTWAEELQHIVDNK